MQVGIFRKQNIVSAWYQSVARMYKSDHCKLAQLYLDGGLYLDNDVELTMTLSQDVLVDGVGILSSLVFSELLSSGDSGISTWCAYYCFRSLLY
jgi:hypothetical protein